MEINRQYIGARYVPKFYEGSNGTEWDANHIYEPLTIVTYLNNSYTSKKNVPASIGNPMDNPEYWCATGNYNAQIEAYRQEVAEALESFNELEETVEGVETKLGHVNTINVKDYGAYGDGVHDDTQAIKDAVQAAVTSGVASIVLLPKGQYLVSSSIDIMPVDNCNITLEGSGRGSSLFIRANTFNGDIITTSHGGYAGVENVGFQNGGQTGSYFGATGAAVRFGTRGYARNLLIFNGQYGVKIDSNNVVLDNIEFTADYVYTADYTSVAGLLIGESYHVSGIIITDCKLMGQDVNANHPLGYGILIEGADGIQICNSSANGNVGVGLIAHGNFNIDDVYLSNCVIDNCVSHCVQLYGDTGVKKNVKFTGCHINGTTTGDMVALEKFENVQFIGCNFQLGYGNTIVMGNMKRVIIDTSIFESNVVAGVPNLQEIAGSGDSITITNNIFDSADATFDVVCDNMTNAVVLGNSFKHGMYGTPSVGDNNLVRA